MIFIMVKNLIRLSVVFHIKASDLVKQLRMMDFDDNGPRTQVLVIIGILHHDNLEFVLTGIHSQMKFLVDEMTHSLPSIAPMGLVQINVQLIPTVLNQINLIDQNRLF